MTTANFFDKNAHNIEFSSIITSGAFIRVVCSVSKFEIHFFCVHFIDLFDEFLFFFSNLGVPSFLIEFEHIFLTSTIQIVVRYALL